MIVKPVHSKLRLIKYSGLVAVMVAGIAATHPARADIVSEGRSMIQSMSVTVIQALKNSGVGRAERERRFRTVFLRNFDVPTIGRFVMGRAWRAASAEQRREYLALFTDYIAKSYTVQFQQYSGERFKVVASEPDGRGVSVLSHLVNPGGGAPIAIRWRIRRSAGRLVIRDVIIENISMSLNQRREFASVYRNTGSVDGVISAMRRKIKQLNRR